MWYKCSMKNIYKTRVKAFTLVELMVVIGIIMVVVTMSFGSSYVMKDQIEFRNATQSVAGMLRDARNLALSGQSYPDVNDFDQDDLDETSSPADQVLPNGYIVNIDASTAGGPVTIELYADLNGGTGMNVFDGDDVFIESIDLPVDVSAIFMATDKNGDATILTSPNNVFLIYTTPDAKFHVIDNSMTSVQVQLMQNDNQGNIMRDTYIYMNYMYGTPEVMSDAYMGPL
jgi:type II secretory pathway pseudopilin PulG